MSLNTKILKIKNHKINIDTAWIINTDSSTSNDISQNVSIKASEVVGDIVPLININEFIFTESDVKYLEINESGFTPTIKIKVIDRTGAFTHKFFPRNKSLMKIYVKSNNKNVKAIRCDFLITNIKSSYGGNDVGMSEGRGCHYTIDGILNIPKITDNQTHIYNETAYNALFDLVDNIDLGFSTNELSTNDKMSWIQPNMSYQEMVEFITDHAYKDGDSFYTSFIDRYYNLTFINMKDMLSQDTEFDAMFLSLTQNKSYYDKNNISDTNDTPVDNILTNFSGHKGLPNFITGYKPSSKQGLTLLENPNRKNMYYYDINASTNNAEKFISMFVEPFGSVITDEEIGNNQINVWSGIDYNNTHRNFIYAEHSNAQNIIDYNKTKLSVSLIGVNLNLLRGMRVPVMIFKEGFENEMNEETYLPENHESSDVKNLNGNVTYDADNSGYYVINNIRFIYDHSTGSNHVALRTELELGRYDWGKNIDPSKFDKNINNNPI